MATAPEVKGPKTTKFDPTNHISAQHLDLVHHIRTKFGMNILLDLTNKFAQEFYQLGQNPRWTLEVKGPKSTKFDSTNHISARHLDPVHAIWTKGGIGMDILDPKNKPVQEFLILRKIQDGRRGSNA